MKKIIEQNDLNALIGKALTDFEAYGKNRALVTLMLAHLGGRSNEVLRLTADSLDIVEDNGRTHIRVFIEASKNGKNRWLTLPTYLLAHVKNLKAQLTAKDCQMAALVGIGATSVESAYELCRLYFNQIQVEMFGEQRYTLHAFRHTLAMIAIASGEYNLVQVKLLLGHKSIQSTMRYLEEYESTLVLQNVHTLIKKAN